MTILVTGATGSVGRHVVEELVRRRAGVRALSRDPEKANLPEEVEVVSGDLAKPETLLPTLEGVTGVHLINFNGGEYGNAALETGPEIVELAAKAGVRKITVLCGGEEGSVERAVRDSSLEWTLLKPVEFMAGHDLDWGESIRAEGVVREPFVDRTSAVVHEADIGAVAAAVLAEGDCYSGKTLVITGPEALTLSEKVKIIGAAVGKDIQLIELSEAQACEKWRAEGYPEELVEFLVSVYKDTPAEGYTVAPTVERVTGRPARTFAQWAAEHADAFRP